MKRSEVQEDLKWDLSPLLNQKTVDQNVKDVNQYANTIISLKGKLTSSKDNFVTFLENQEKLGILLSQLNCYFENLDNQDTSNQDNTRQKMQFMQFYQGVTVALSFIDNEILDNQKTIEQYLADPKLAEYKFHFSKAFRYQSHRLNNDVELVINTLSLPLSGMSDVFNKLTNADFIFAPIKDSKGEMHQLTQGNYAAFASHDDEELRKNAYNSFWNTYFHHKFSLSSIYFFHLNTFSTIAKLKNYNSSIDSALFNNFIEVDFYQKLLNKVSSKTDHILEWKKFLAKRTGINDPKPWDWSGPLFKASNRQFSIVEAKDIVFKSLAPLGISYQEKIKYMFENNCIDWMPNDNKRSGAYSYGVWGSAPYILMNWNGKYRDLSTLIHELGHSIHTLHSTKKQPYIYYSYPILLAEIASIFNEIMLYFYLIKNDKIEKEIKILATEQLIKEFIGAVYRQGQFAEFEFLAHDRIDKKQPLDVGTIIEMCSQISAKYNPKLKSQKNKDPFENLWGMFVPHFYANFYVYQYITGMIVAVNFAQNVIDNKPDAASNYIKFLESGCRYKPLDTIKAAGVDLKADSTYDTAFNFFGDLIKNLVKLTENES